MTLQNNMNKLSMEKYLYGAEHENVVLLNKFGIHQTILRFKNKG